MLEICLVYNFESIIIGIYFIICCVVLISIGGDLNEKISIKEEGNESRQDKSLKEKYLFISVGFAILCGIVFALNTL